MTLGDGLRNIGSHKWLLIACVLVSVATTSIVLSFFPARYRAETRIIVVPTTVPDEYVHLPKPERMASRLNAIQQMVLTRSRLERIVEEYDLYSEMRQHANMEDVVEAMRRHDISLEIDGDDSFRINFYGNDPRTVQKVTDRLGSLFIMENMDQRTAVAESTSQFIDSQVAFARERLVRREDELHAAARAGHASTLSDKVELEVLQQQYRDLVTKREEAKLVENLERRQIGEQFRPLPATIPVIPVAPNRLAVNTGGAVAGLGIGVALIAFTTRRRTHLENAVESKAE